MRTNQQPPPPPPPPANPVQQQVHHPALVASEAAGEARVKVSNNAREYTASGVHGELECSSPVHAAGTVPLLLSMNGQQYAVSGAQYTYQPAAAVSYISPSSALAEGGTPLTVHGDGFSSASEALGLLMCRIGGAVRRAVWASANAVVSCATRRYLCVLEE